jgi:predicted kinase
MSFAYGTKIQMKLIVFSGLPGTGKSTLAEAVGKQLSIPVFAKDWLEATLIRSNLVPVKNHEPVGSIGYELLTMLAERQLVLNQSVILDSVASTQSIRDAWYSLSQRYHADWRVIECICSDETFHRQQLSKRQRKIPGWHELEWADIEKVKGYFVHWKEDHLILDMMNPFEDNFAKALAYCGWTNCAI